MARFAKLERPVGRPMWINAEKVVLIRNHPTMGQTEILFSDSYIVVVKGNPEEIIEALSTG